MIETLKRHLDLKHKARNETFLRQVQLMVDNPGVQLSRAKRI